MIMCQSTFVVTGVSTHLGDAVRVELRYAQVFGNTGYE